MGSCRQFFRRLHGRASGFSLVEVMIAGGLIAFIAVALMPAVFSVIDTSKASGFKAVCTAAVRAKLQEYVNGMADNSLGLDGANTYIPTGFEYTKARWRQYGAGSCSMAPSPAAPGYRESVYGNAVLGATSWEKIPGTTQTAVMNGFQLWVMMRRYNPRKLVDSTGAYTATNGIPSRDCDGNNQSEQFFRLGDAIEVTVTGMARTDGAISAGGRGGAGVGKLYDLGHPSGTQPNPLLVCSATELIYPPRVPFRYYIGVDGKLRNYQAGITTDSGAAASSTNAMEAHFRSVWTNGSNTVANIRSIAVSPDNQWVFVLRPGELTRYGPCDDTGAHSITYGATTYHPGDGSNSLGITGIPDCPPVPSTTTGAGAALNNLKWTVSPLLENIAVDFGNDLDTWDKIDMTQVKVYGLLGSVSGLSVHGNSYAGLVKLDLTTTNTTYDVAGIGDFKLPANRPRIRGMFIAQTFPSVAGSPPNLFFFDNTCYTTGSVTAQQSSYCASIFNSSDSDMQQTVREMPNQVEAISY